MELSLLRNGLSLMMEGPRDESLREDAITDVLKRIDDVEAPHAERVEFVKLCLRDASSDMVRNQATLALVELVSKDAASDIIRVLRDRDISGSSGTLLFALNEIEADVPLDILARTVVGGSYEAQNEAMFALEQGRVASADDEVERRAVADVSPLLDGDDATAEVAAALLARIRDGTSKRSTR